MTWSDHSLLLKHTASHARQTTWTTSVAYSRIKRICKVRIYSCCQNLNNSEKSSHLLILSKTTPTALPNTPIGCCSSEKIPKTFYVQSYSNTPYHPRRSSLCRPLSGESPFLPFPSTAPVYHLIFRNSPQAHSSSSRSV